MSKMTVVINDDLEKRFRATIFEDKGMKRGNIHAAIEEAMEMWIKEKAAKKGGYD